jgi:hypothetical protein
VFHAIITAIASPPPQNPTSVGTVRIEDGFKIYKQDILKVSAHHVNVFWLVWSSSGG